MLKNEEQVMQSLFTTYVVIIYTACSPATEAGERLSAARKREPKANGVDRRRPFREVRLFSGRRVAVKNGRVGGDISVAFVKLKQSQQVIDSGTYMPLRRTWPFLLKANSPIPGPRFAIKQDVLSGGAIKTVTLFEFDVKRLDKVPRGKHRAPDVVLIIDIDSRGFLWVSLRQSVAAGMVDLRFTTSRKGEARGAAGSQKSVRR
ncbi:MAG: hypothetical protein ACE5I7_20375 [Candidatus Binatia bacterium]